MKQKQALDCNRPITGCRVCLRRLEPKHADLLLDSFRNETFWNAYRTNQNRDLSRTQLTQQLQFEYERLPAQVAKIEWLIERLPSDHEDSNDPDNSVGHIPVGLASLSAFDAAQGRAEFLIGLFHKDQIRTGVALEASLLVMDQAFNQLGLHKLVSFVYADNPPAQESTLALGFRNEGLLKEHLRKGESGEYLDVYQNCLLRKEFRNNERLARLSRRLLGIDVTRDTLKLEDQKDSARNKLSLNASFTID